MNTTSYPFLVDMDIDSVSTERSFLEFLCGQPREPDWTTGILYGIEGWEEQDIHEIKQVSTCQYGLRSYARSAWITKRTSYTCACGCLR